MTSRVRCLMRYIDQVGYQEMSDYLLSNKFVKEEELLAAKHTQERAELILTSLKRAEAEEKLLLLDFTWTILPFEQIKITCVSPREERQFTYGF